MRPQETILLQKDQEKNQENIETINEEMLEDDFEIETDVENLPV